MCLPHWNYFLALESDVVRLSRFVEFATDNYQAYSVEMAHLLLAAASEVDVLAKMLCKRLDGRSTAANVNQYHKEIVPKFPGLKNTMVMLPRHGLSLTPWQDWEHRSPPRWWTANNKVKHQRNDHFGMANLENVLNSMAGLLVFALFFYRSDRERIEPPPSLFVPPRELASVMPTYGGPMVLCFAQATPNGGTHAEAGETADPRR